MNTVTHKNSLYRFGHSDCLQTAYCGDNVFSIMSPRMGFDCSPGVGTAAAAALTAAAALARPAAPGARPEKTQQ